MREKLARAQNAAALAQEQSSRASTSESAAAARKLRQLEIQLADAETRAQSHAAILERHQLRKDAQEKKVGVLQVCGQNCYAENSAAAHLFFIMVFLSF